MDYMRCEEGRPDGPYNDYKFGGTRVGSWVGTLRKELFVDGQC